jgi:hypothetical protein
MRLAYRRKALRAVAGLGALFWGFFFYGLIDLLVPLVQGEGFYESYLLETGWGVLYFMLVGVPLLCVTIQPELVSPVAQVALAGCAVGMIAVLTPAWLQLLPAAGLLLTAGLVHLFAIPQTDRSLFAWRRPVGAAAGMDASSLLLTLAGAVPLIWFAAEMVASSRDGRPPTDDITAGLNHWPMQAALALTILSTAGLAALRQVGWQMSAWTVIAGTAWMGGFSVAFPQHAGSFGRPGGWVAILWSALFAVATLRSSHTRLRIE